MKTKRLIYLSLVAVILSSCSKLEKGRMTTVEHNGMTYTGEIKNDHFDGYGLLMKGDSVIYRGYWKAGKRNGNGFAQDSLGRKFCATWKSDTIVQGKRIDSLGTYTGQFDFNGKANGHGMYIARDGSVYEGRWKEDQRCGFGMGITSKIVLRTGEWKSDRYLGEKLSYTSERIYGIDISKYQHEIGRKKYSISWNNLRIKGLGSISHKTVKGKVNYPISFVYIKSTEGKSVFNKYYRKDYVDARLAGYRVGTYHFFSIYSSASLQAHHFIKRSMFRQGDFPPVLDVEPSNEQIRKMGGSEALFAAIRTWMNIVESKVGVRPILYVSQHFVNKYLPLAPDLKKKYQVWIARYGEYKPDVRLIYWQLCPDGQVQGIQGKVDINVFNGYRNEFYTFINNRTK